MNDEELKQKLKSGLQAMQPDAPRFAEVWSAAKAVRSKSRRSYAGLAAAAAAVSLLTIVLWPAGRLPDDSYLNELALLNSTHWSAPSDVLMSDLDWGVYQDIPQFIESTEMQEGTLL